MIGSKGNSEFCFPGTLNVPRGEAEWNIEVEGKQNSMYSPGLVIKCFVILPNSKIAKKLRIIVCLTPAGSQIYRGFKERNLITCESKVVVALRSY